MQREGHPSIFLSTFSYFHFLVLSVYLTNPSLSPLSAAHFPNRCRYLEPSTQTHWHVELSILLNICVRVAEFSECVSAHVACCKSVITSDSCVCMCVFDCSYGSYLISRKLSLRARSVCACVCGFMSTQGGSEWLRGSAPPAASLERLHHLFLMDGWEGREEVWGCWCVCLCEKEEAESSELQLDDKICFVGFFCELVSHKN